MGYKVYELQQSNSEISKRVDQFQVQFGSMIKDLNKDRALLERMNKENASLRSALQQSQEKITLLEGEVIEEKERERTVSSQMNFEILKERAKANDQLSQVID